MDLLEIKGIGKKKAQALNRLGIESSEDLILYSPDNYQVFDSLNYLKEAGEGKVKITLKITGPTKTSRIRGGKFLTKAYASDGRDECQLIWFNQPYMDKQIREGNLYEFSGQIEKEKSFKMLNPKIIKGEENSGPEAVYPLTQGITNKDLNKFIKEAYLIEEDGIPEIFPREIREEEGLLTNKSALYRIHWPKSLEEAEDARRSLAFSESFIDIHLNSIEREKNKGRMGNVLKNDRLLNRAIRSLDFELTMDQTKAIEDIRSDMASPSPMNRLLQGDVGSGKTVVAILASIIAAGSSYQTAFMVPSLLLANQHYKNWSPFLKDLKISSALLTGQTKSSDRKVIEDGLKSGRIDIVFGTHSLINPDLEFENLGLCITDEQHRFGVRQRSSLANKADSPDVLVMTATPIPRTLSLIYYGDLDISIIREKPPGREKIETYLVPEDIEGRFLKFVGAELEKGRQAYVVSPMIEEGDMDLNSVEKVFKRFNCYFPDKRIEKLHGQMTDQEKSKIMEDFYRDKIDILISTTVIEVGLDVKNASVMLVYDSDRFGLAQLHQLRGRVGRGEYQSYCILVTSSRDPSQIKRLKIMEKTDDGFEIAESDLKRRGSGDHFGFRQSGRPSFNWLRLDRDYDLISRAKSLSESFIRGEIPVGKDLEKVLAEKRNNRDKIAMN